jgi:glycosyltransferase involved in cell wall biosynthesis
MRICSPQLRLSPEATLGGEVYDREILTRLADLGVEVEVILPAGLPHPQAPNLRFTHPPLKRGYRWFVSNPLFVPYIGRAYRNQPFDLLRVHSLRFTGPGALAARRLYRLPVPIAAHHHHVDRDSWTDLIERRIVRYCDMIVTVSQFARQQLISQLDAPAEQIRVVYNGVGSSIRPLPRDERLAAQWGATDRRVLLYLGSLKPRKNLPVLLQALRMVLQERDDVCLLVVGQGESEADLQRQVRSLGLERAVCFVGRVPEAEKVAWYNLADVFVLPSLLEGFGLAAAEAMACGKPVVASRAGGLPEVVADGITGMLCNPEAPVEFAQAILRLLGNRSVAKAMGEAGRERVERLFRWEGAARAIHQCYRRLLEARARSVE